MNCVQVLNHLIAATRSMRRLPKVGVKNTFCAWPDIIRSYHEAYNTTNKSPAKVALTSRQLSELDQAIIWLTWLEPTAARVLWASCEGYSWRKIAAIAGKSDKTCKKIAQDAVVEITWRLQNA